MNRSLLAAIAAAVSLAACSQKPAATCSTNADCPKDAICVTGVCQKGVPSGGAEANVAGASRLTASGTKITMDAVIGQPVTPAAKSGTRTMEPADNTR
jgi:hypothetical protein